MKKIILFTALFLPVHILSAQDILTSPLNWTVTKIIDSQSQTPMNFQCTFESGSDSIKWIQKGGRYVKTFTVNNVQGTWPNVQSMGEVTFSVTLDGQTGSLKFWKDSTGSYINVNLSLAGADPLLYTFSVSQVAVIN